MTGVIRIRGCYPDLQVHDHGGYQSRHISTLALLREVFQRNSQAFIGLHYNFCICSVDNPESANVLAEKMPYVLTYSKTNNCRPNIIPIPDFMFHSWPEVGITSYESCTQNIIQAGESPATIFKVFWIGNIDTDPTRHRLLEIGRRHSNNMEFISMTWQQSEGTSLHRLDANYFVSLPEHCRYSMLLDIRGASYSGRLKLLLHARRPVFMVERQFHEFFFDLMAPNETYIPVRADLSDLDSQVKKVKSDSQFSEYLSQNSQRFAQQYLTKNYAMNYLHDVLLKISLPKSLIL